MVWQVQQMVQAAALLLGSTAPVASTDASFRADAVATQRTSLGLQLLNLPSLEWPEPAVKPSNQGADGAMPMEDSEPETDDETSALNPETAEESDDTEETAPTRDQDADEAIGMENSEPETDDSTEKDSTEDVSAADISSDNEEPDDETSALNPETADESDDTCLLYTSPSPRD